MLTAMSKVAIAGMTFDSLVHIPSSLSVHVTTRKPYNYYSSSTEKLLGTENLFGSNLFALFSCDVTTI